MAVADIDYQQLADDIALLSGGIPEHIVGQVIPLSVQEYFSETRALTTPVTGAINGNTLRLDEDGDLEPVAVSRVVCAGHNVPVYSLRAGFESRDFCCALAAVYADDGREVELRFFRTPPEYQQAEVTALVTYSPTREATSCPLPRDSGISLRALTALVLSKLYAMPNRPWTDLAQAQLQFAIYGDLVVKAKRIAKSNDSATNRECTFSW